MGAEFRQFCETQGIQQEFVSPTTRHKSFLAERAIRTLRGYLGRLRRSGVRVSFPKLLEIVERTYNARRANPITGLTPDETTDEVAPSLLHQSQKKRASLPPVDPKFEVGDYVLVRRPKELFGLKTDESAYYSTIYRIHSFKLAMLSRRYFLEGQGEVLSGSFAESQLAKVDNKQPIGDVKQPRPPTVQRERSPIATRSKGSVYFLRQM